MWSFVNSIFSICACFRWGMYLQLAILLIGVIMSCRTTNWLGLFCLFRWYVIRTAKTAAARMSIYVSASYTYVFCIWYARIIFPNVWYILYMVVFTCVFPGEAVLVLIPYSCSIKLLLKIVTEELSSSVIHDFYWPRISDQLRSFCQFYNRHFFLFVILCYFKSPGMGFIIVTDFNIRGYLHFLRIL